MRLAASTRSSEGRIVKLLVLGNRSGAGHAHEDKGSFVLEWAGQTFAMDPGTCAYSDPLSLTLKHCGRHNMLVPIEGEGRAHPENPLGQDVDIHAWGDEREFHARMDLAPGWGNHYVSWERRIDSVSPLELCVTDEYELVRGEGVEFYWNTCLDVRIRGGTVVITGGDAEVVIDVPPGTVARVDDLPLPSELGEVQHRIVFAQAGRRGRMEVRARLSGGRV